MKTTTNNNHEAVDDLLTERNPELFTPWQQTPKLSSPCVGNAALLKSPASESTSHVPWWRANPCTHTHSHTQSKTHENNDAKDRNSGPVPANVQQLHTAEEEWTNIPQATKEMANGGHTRYWLVPPPPQYSKTAHFRVAFYCGQPKAHLCNNHAV